MDRMTSDQWKNRILAVTRAANAGDLDPLGIVCGELEAMSDLLADPPAPVVLPTQPVKPLVSDGGDISLAPLPTLALTGAE